MRVLMSSDASEVYLSNGGCASIFYPATDSFVNPYLACYLGDNNEDMAMSSDGSTIVTADLLTDPNLNVDGDITYVDRDVWLPLEVYGQKLNSDGSLEFTPLTNGVDVHNTSSGLLAYRVELPIQLANAYDALAIDDADGLLFAITANGAVELNLSSLPPVNSDATALKRRRQTPVLRVEQYPKRRAQTQYFDLPHLRRQAERKLR